MILAINWKFDICQVLVIFDPSKWGIWKCSFYYLSSVQVRKKTFFEGFQEFFTCVENWEMTEIFLNLEFDGKLVELKTTKIRWKFDEIVEKVVLKWQNKAWIVLIWHKMT